MNRNYIFLTVLFLISAGMGYAGEEIKDSSRPMIAYQHANDSKSSHWLNTSLVLNSEQPESPNSEQSGLFDGNQSLIVTPGSSQPYTFTNDNSPQEVIAKNAAIQTYLIAKSAAMQTYLDGCIKKMESIKTTIIDSVNTFKQISNSSEYKEQRKALCELTNKSIQEFITLISQDPDAAGTRISILKKAILHEDSNCQEIENIIENINITWNITESLLGRQNDKPQDLFNSRILLNKQIEQLKEQSSKVSIKKEETKQNIYVLTESLEYLENALALVPPKHRLAKSLTRDLNKRIEEIKVTIEQLKANGTTFSLKNYIAYLKNKKESLRKLATDQRGIISKDGINPSALLEITKEIKKISQKISDLETKALDEPTSSSSSIDLDDIPSELINSSSSSENNSAQLTELSHSDSIHPADIEEFSLTNLLRSCGTNFETLSSGNTTTTTTTTTTQSQFDTLEIEEEFPAPSPITTTTTQPEQSRQAPEEYKPNPKDFTLTKLRENDQQNNSSSDDTVTTTTTTQPSLEDVKEKKEEALQQNQNNNGKEKDKTPPQEKTPEITQETQEAIDKALQRLAFVQEIKIKPFEGAGGELLRSRDCLKINTPDEYISNLHTLAQHAKPFDNTNNTDKDNAIRTALTNTKHVEFLKYLDANEPSMKTEDKSNLTTVRNLLSEKKYTEFMVITGLMKKERKQIEEALTNINYFTSDKMYDEWKKKIDNIYPRFEGDKEIKRKLISQCDQKYAASYAAYQAAYKKIASKQSIKVDTESDKTINHQYNSNINLMLVCANSIEKTKGFFATLLNFWTHRKVIKNFEAMKNDNLIPADDSRIQTIETKIADYKAKSWWSTIGESLYWLCSFSWIK